MELVPSFGDADVTHHLETALVPGSSLRAAIAFWTIKPRRIRGLVPALRGSGFLCVDLGLPTDIDMLANLAEAGCNVHLHIAGVEGETEDQPRVSKMPSHIMHAKTLLIDPAQRGEGKSNEEAAVLWVGSHNWTRRALEGPNIELSLRTHVASTSDVYRNAVEFLENVKAASEAFDLAKIDYYKWLQRDRKERERTVLRIQTADVKDLHGEHDLWLFSDRPGDFDKAAPLSGRKVVLDVRDDAGGAELWDATVVQVGRLDGSILAAKRFAFRRGTAAPRVDVAAGPPADYFSMQGYWLKFQLKRSLPDAHLAEARDAPDWWVRTDDPLLTRCSEAMRTKLTKKQGRGIKRPQEDDGVELRAEQPALEGELFHKLALRRGKRKG